MMASLLPLLSPWAEQLVVKVRANLVADLQRDCRKLLVATTSIETFVYYAYIYIYIYIMVFLSFIVSLCFPGFSVHHFLFMTACPLERKTIPNNSTSAHTHTHTHTYVHMQG